MPLPNDMDCMGFTWHFHSYGFRPLARGILGGSPTFISWPHVMRCGGRWFLAIACRFCWAITPAWRPGGSRRSAETGGLTCFNHPEMGIYRNQSIYIYSNRIYENPLYPKFCAPIQGIDAITKPGFPFWRHEPPWTWIEPRV
jgi:hypothetical protein